ncbi:MAG: hypothetical protein MSH65_03935 [Spirochaetia bacterium]|nr:hypothetical protein [Spirochaetia bacterium]
MEELSPNQLAPLLEKRLAELQNLLFTKKKSYEKAPKGRIRISQNGGHPEYYLVTERGSLRGKYLPHSQKTLARQLAQKDYDARLIKLLQKEISTLQNYMKQTSNGRAIPELYDSLCPARRSLITPAILTNEQYAARWLDVSWTGRPFASDAPYICTARGERVRSKSEVIIADTLFRHNIPYRYEFPITLKRSNSADIRRDFGSSITLYPDFLCLNTRTRTEFYWEHFGLMDSTEYSNNAAGKLRLYTENGILAGRNLIITMETQTEPPSIKALEKLIEEFLL